MSGSDSRDRFVGETEKILGFNQKGEGVEMIRMAIVGGVLDGDAPFLEFAGVILIPGNRMSGGMMNLAVLIFKFNPGLALGSDV